MEQSLRLCVGTLRHLCRINPRSCGEVVRIAGEENAMNKLRRKRIARAIDLIERAKAILRQVADDEQAIFDNLPKGPQSSELGEAMEIYIYTIEDFLAALDVDNLQDIVDE